MKYEVIMRPKIRFQIFFTIIFVINKIKKFLVVFLLTFVFISCGPTEEEMLIIDEAIEICADSRQALKKVWGLLNNYESLIDRHFMFIELNPSHKTQDEWSAEFILYLDKEWEKINKLSNELNEIDKYVIPLGVLPQDKENYHLLVKYSLEDAKKAVYYYLQIIDSMEKDAGEKWRFPSKQNNIVTQELRDSKFEKYDSYYFNYEKYEDNLLDNVLKADKVLRDKTGKCYLEN